MGMLTLVKFIQVTSVIKRKFDVRLQFQLSGDIPRGISQSLTRRSSAHDLFILRVLWVVGHFLEHSGSTLDIDIFAISINLVVDVMFQVDSI